MSEGSNNHEQLHWVEFKLGVREQSRVSREQLHAGSLYLRQSTAHLLQMLAAAPLPGLGGGSQPLLPLLSFPPGDELLLHAFQGGTKTGETKGSPAFRKFEKLFTRPVSSSY